jgi:LacI family transcriptional regulator
VTASSTLRDDRAAPRPTIRDVAALAGASLKSVSRVVNGEAGVSADLSARVQRAIDQLGYRHNLSASSLRRADGRSRSIGLLLSSVANPFGAGIHRAIEVAAAARGTVVLAASVNDDPDRERDLITTMMQRRVDGLIVTPTAADHSYLVRERSLGTPFVFVDRAPAFFDADTVTVDNSDGVLRGMAHLIAHGHRRVAFLGDRAAIQTAQHRHRGYLQALAAAGIGPDPSIAFMDVLGSEHAQSIIVKLLTGSQPPTAILAAQNLLAMGALRALRTLDLHHRVALVSFDDIPNGDLLEPGVTVLRQDIEAIGRTAAELMFARLDGDQSPSQHRVVPVELVPRGSGELAPSP